MEVSKTLLVSTRAEWRQWLKKNYKTTADIWLVFYKKASGKIRIPYNDAVEEALCFGWIDSIVKSPNEEYYLQRFSPRKSKSPYSQINKERLRKLIKQKKVMPEILEKIKDMLAEEFLMPDDILQAIKKDKDAWEHFQKFSDQYKRIRIAFIVEARSRPEEFNKRLQYFIKMTSLNKQFGFGQIEEYFN